MAHELVPAPEQAALSGSRMYPDDLQPALQEAMSMLADVELRYSQHRDALDRWDGPEEIKRRLSRDLDEWRRKAREPHAQRLAELHMKTVNLLMFRNELR